MTTLVWSVLSCALLVLGVVLGFIAADRAPHLESLLLKLGPRYLLLDTEFDAVLHAPTRSAHTPTDTSTAPRCGSDRWHARTQCALAREPRVLIVTTRSRHHFTS